MFDSDRPASESSPYNSEGSEPRFKATLTFEGNAYEVKAAIFGRAEEAGRYSEIISSLNQQITELKNQAHDRDSDVRREQLRADRAEDDAREARRNHQVVLSRERDLNANYYGASSECNQLRVDNERLRMALKSLEGGNEILKSVEETTPASTLTYKPEEVATTLVYEPRHKNAPEVLYQEIPEEKFSEFLKSLHGLRKPMGAADFGHFLRSVASLVRSDVDDNVGKIQVIRMLRAATGLGLREAKDLFEFGEIK